MPTHRRPARRRFAPAALVALSALLLSPWATADDWLDHDSIKQLRDSGAILPMEQVLAQALAEQPGELIEAELEREDGRYLYEVKVLANDGQVHELTLDATTAEVLGRHEKTRRHD